MKRLLKGTMLICVVIGLFSLVACGQSAAGTGSATSFQITRSSTVKNNIFPVFTKTVQDQAMASQLYDAIQQLPTQKTVFCPLDNGLQYGLIFTQPGGTQIHIVLSASGCRSAVLKSNDRRATNSTFWSLLARTVGVPEDDIFVKPA